MLRDGDERDCMLVYNDDVDEVDEDVCDAQCCQEEQEEGFNQSNRV